MTVFIKVFVETLYVPVLAEASELMNPLSKSPFEMIAMVSAARAALEKPVVCSSGEGP